MEGFSSGEMFEGRGRFGDRGDTMSQRAFIGLLSLLVASGLALAAYVASLTYTMVPQNWWIFAYFAVAIPGIFISMGNDNWLVSLIGYTMVVFATGAIVGPYVALYQLASVVQVVFITLGVTIALGVAGAIYPKSVEHWGGFLLTGLFVLIFGDIVRLVMAMYGMTPVSLKWIDWVAVMLFSGYVFYDMNRAMRLEYTLDNAVDVAVALYLDVINLFVRLLKIMGKKK